MTPAMRWLMLMVAAAVISCGTPGPPLPPSLNLPDPVSDLSAVRSGNEVTLTWTMPRRNTDKLALKDKVAVRVCRALPPAPCTVVANLGFTPGANGTFQDELPPELAAGAPRPLTYTVELPNAKGRSAGPSNAAEVLAGRAPDGVTGLDAQVSKEGVVLHWAAEPGNSSIRLHRTLLTAPPARVHPGLLQPPPEPILQDLMVPTDEGKALDSTAQFGHSYQYRAQRVVQVKLGGHTLEMLGAESGAVRIDVRDMFPPATPAGLAAVANPATAGAAASIDLNWLPVTDENLTGYVVYRREANGAWQRISPEQPMAAPAYHDAAVQPGHTYIYAVSAVDRLGHESARSSAAEETVPAE